MNPEASSDLEVSERRLDRLPDSDELQPNVFDSFHLRRPFATQEFLAVSYFQDNPSVLVLEVLNFDNVLQGHQGVVLHTPFRLIQLLEKKLVLLVLLSQVFGCH